MKIIQPEQNQAVIELKITEVESIIEELTSEKPRPCLNCLKICPSCQSTSCHCNCNLNCNQVSQQLSSEQDSYPIETKVLPLVFSLSSMSVCQPCWSCEGHLDQQNKIQKIPQVWFYTNSLLLVRLLNNCLNHFQFKKLLNYTWQIAATFSDKTCADSAFTIKPDLNLTAQPDLALLQTDLATIAEHIEPTLKKQCLSYLDDLRLSQNNLKQFK